MNAPANPNKALWEKGDFTRIADTMRESGEALVQRLGITKGLKVLDLGCGDGAFLAALAQENPAHNFLGIERLLGRVRSVCRKVARLDLKNARILRMETNYAVTHLLPPGSVTTFHLLFPDPWPKRRHHRRRAFTPEFVSSIHRALIAGGLFHVATDHADYFHQIERVIAATDIFVISREQNHFPPTSFEQKYVARGLSIHRLLLRKVSPVR